MRSALLHVAIALLPATSSSLHDERQQPTWVRIEGGSFVLGDNYADCPLANRTTAVLQPRARSDAAPCSLAAAQHP